MEDKTRARIEAALSRNPQYEDGRIAKNVRGSNTAMVAAVRAGREYGENNSDGVKLSGKSVLSRRPADSAAKFIKRLDRGKGFSPKDLARKWGMSEETIKRHAREMNCLKFVEVTEDEWTALVMCPETAADYS